MSGDDGNASAATVEQTERCKGRKNDGEPCRSQLGISASGYCLLHDPARREEARAARSKGGAASREAKRARKEEARAKIPAGLMRAPKTLEDAVKWSSWAMHAAAIGELDARTAHEIGYLLARFCEALNKRDLLAQIEKLRAELAAAKGTNRPHVA